MAKSSLPDPETLRKLLIYEADRGVMTWRERLPQQFSNADRYSPERRAKIWNGKNAGKPALAYIGARGYRCGNILGRQMAAHRVAWALHYGEWPDGQIDHIDGDRTNNAIRNLRVCTNAENARNRGAARAEYPGLQWREDCQKWAACITVDYKTHYLGLFPDIDSAIAARKAAEGRHGFHANHGERRSHSIALASRSS